MEQDDRARRAASVYGQTDEDAAAQVWTVRAQFEDFLTRKRRRDPAIVRKTVDSLWMSEEIEEVYPDLAFWARWYLCRGVTSVACESIFSRCRHVTGLFRGGLTAKHLCDQVRVLEHPREFEDAHLMHFPRLLKQRDDILQREEEAAAAREAAKPRRLLRRSDESLKAAAERILAEVAAASRRGGGWQ